MKGKHVKQRSKYNLLVGLLIGLLVVYEFLLPSDAQAVSFARTPQSTQLLPQNPIERLPVFQNLPELTVEQYEPTQSNSKVSLYVGCIKIVGNTVFDTRTLHALVAEGERKTLTLGQLNELAARISHYYQMHNHPFSRAYIPAQTIKNGVIQFNILEAYYGAIRIKNCSRLSCRRARLSLSPLQVGDLVKTSTLNRTLLLLNDLPGIVACSTIGPGRCLGSSDLDVLIKPTKLVNAFLGIDNYGSPYTGRTRLNGSMQFNNPTGQGDRIIVDGVSSGRDLIYGHFGYEYPLYPGYKVGANYSGLTYRLKNSLAPLGAVGEMNLGDLWLSYDWVRQVHVNVNSVLRYTYKNLQDDQTVIGFNKRRHSNAGSLENAAEFIDRYGKTNVYLAITQGNLAFKNAFDGGGFDSVTARTAGAFTKGNLHLSRLQEFTPATSLYVGGDVQLSSKNLDSSEQLVLGGPYIVRSYEVGAISGAQGYTATAELRHIMNVRMSGVWRPLAFFDIGRVQIYKDQFFPEPNIFNLYGIGVGLDIAWKDWILTARAAHRIGATPPPFIATSIDDNKLWVQLGRNF